MTKDHPLTTVHKDIHSYIRTGEPLDKLPKGSVPMWQRNGEGNRIEKEIEPVKEEFPF